MKLTSAKYLLILLVSILIESISFAGEAEKYFPLHVGDTWNYYHELYVIDDKLDEILTAVDTVTVSVSQIEEIDGNTYYYLLSSEILFNGYYRTEGNYVYRYDEKFNYDSSSYDVAMRGEGSGEWIDDNYVGEYYRMVIDTACASLRFDDIMSLPSILALMR